MNYRNTILALLVGICLAPAAHAINMDSIGLGLLGSTALSGFSYLAAYNAEYRLDIKRAEREQKHNAAESELAQLKNKQQEASEPDKEKLNKKIQRLEKSIKHLSDRIKRSDRIAGKQSMIEDKESRTKMIHFLGYTTLATATASVLYFAYKLAQ